MEKETVVISLTAHRKLPGGYSIYTPENLALAMKVREYLLSHLKQGKRVHGISGMAPGGDIIYARVLLKLKKQGYDVILECAIPCNNHSKNRPKDGQKEWQEIVDLADIVTYVSKEDYRKELLDRRNEYMVDRGDELITLWNGSRSGTYNCLMYANEQGKPITLIINPNQMIIPDKGDLLYSDCDILLHQCNCQSTMGTGVAKQIKDRYQAAWYADLESTMTPEQKFGMYTSANAVNHLGRRIEIVNLYGQFNYGRNEKQTSEPHLRSALLTYLADKQSMNQLTGKKIGIPFGMGCGNAGGDWEEVMKILEEATKAFNISIYTYKKDK